VCICEVCVLCDRLLFYVDQGDQSSDSHFHGPCIATAYMDGSMNRVIHRGDLLSPQQLTLDRVNGRIYFTDPQQNAIFQLDYDAADTRWFTGFLCVLKVEFHDADTDTDILARILARK